MSADAFTDVMMSRMLTCSGSAILPVAVLSVFRVVPVAARAAAAARFVALSSAVSSSPPVNDALASLLAVAAVAAEAEAVGSGMNHWRRSRRKAIQNPWQKMWSGF